MIKQSYHRLCYQEPIGGPYDGRVVVARTKVKAGTPLYREDGSMFTVDEDLWVIIPVGKDLLETAKSSMVLVPSRVLKVLSL